MSAPATCWEDAYRVQTERLEELRRENAALRKAKEMVELERCEMMRSMSLAQNRSKQLRADKERLDWLEKARPIAWALESVNCGKYWLLTEIGERHPEEAEEFATLRAAIDAARKEARP